MNLYIYIYIYIYNNFENDLKILTDIQLSLHQFDVLFIYLDKRQSDIGKELYIVRDFKKILIVCFGQRSHTINLNTNKKNIK